MKIEIILYSAKWRYSRMRLARFGQSPEIHNPAAKRVRKPQVASNHGILDNKELDN